MSGWSDDEWEDVVQPQSANIESINDQPPSTLTQANNPVGKESRKHIARASRLQFLHELDTLEGKALAALEKELHISATIASMSGQFTVGGSVELSKLVSLAPNAELDKKKRPNVHIRLRNPKCSVQVNPSGFVSILGGKTRAQLYTASRQVASVIRRSKAFPDARMEEFKLNNIVVSCKTPEAVRKDIMEAHLVNLGFNAVSEQEIFPCLRVALTYPKPHSCKVFRTGALIFMGLKSVVDVVESIRYFYPILQSLNARNDFSAIEEIGGFKVRNVRQEKLDRDFQPKLPAEEYERETQVQEEEDFTLEHSETV